MIIRPAIFATLLAVAGCAQQPDSAVSDGMVRLPAVEGSPGAAYFTLHGGDAGRTLVTVESPDAGRAEMHDMTMTNGMMKMAPLTQGVVIPKNGTVTFAPGGKHVMLFGMKAGLKPGDPILLNFTFANGETAQLMAEAESPGGSDAHSH
jgi:copper(I)-binding protein